MRRISHLERFVEEEHKYFNSLYENNPGFKSHDEIERALRAVLQVFRDRLPMEESFNVLAQLPSFLKLYFIEGWKFRSTPLRIRTLDDFVLAVEDKLIRLGEINYERDMTTEELISIIIKQVRLNQLWICTHRKSHFNCPLRYCTTFPDLLPHIKLHLFLA